MLLGEVEWVISAEEADKEANRWTANVSLLGCYRSW